MDTRISLICLIFGSFIFLIFNTKALNYINDHLNNDFSLFLFLHSCFSATLSVVICESLQGLGLITRSIPSVFLTWLILTELPIVFIYTWLIYRNYVIEKSKKLAEEIEQISSNLKKNADRYSD